jgi:lysozyme family protein
MIDAAKKSGAATAKLIDAYFKNDDSMTALVNDFYKKQFWDAVPVEITGKLREKFFDTSINLGKKGASIVLQRALNALGSNLIVDGAIGKLTKAALAKYTEPRILSQYVKAQEKYYRDIVARKPSQNVFLKGWLRRAAWLPL